MDFVHRSGRSEGQQAGLGARPTDEDLFQQLLGRTAVITGASSGIGAEFARQLARKGLSVVLVARRADLLEHVAGEIRNAGGSCEVQVADLVDMNDLERVGKVFGRSDVAMLVNCAGVATYSQMSESSPDAIEDMISVNVVALTMLSKAAVDAFLVRGFGVLLNVSSTAAFKPMPGLTVYGATKAFVKELSLSLREEVRGQGVEVCVVCPGFVHTDMITSALGRPIAPSTRIGRLLERHYLMSPEECVRRSLEGLRRRKSLVTTDPVDRMVTRLPRFLIHRIDTWSLRHLTGDPGT